MTSRSQSRQLLRPLAGLVVLLGLIGLLGLTLEQGGPRGQAGAVMAAAHTTPGPLTLRGSKENPGGSAGRQETGLTAGQVAVAPEPRVRAAEPGRDSIGAAECSQSAGGPRAPPSFA